MMDLKDKSRAVFNAMMRKHSDFFGGPVFCDLQSSLYTVTELQLPEVDVSVTTFVDRDLV